MLNPPPFGDLHASSSSSRPTTRDGTAGARSVTPTTSQSQSQSQSSAGTSSTTNNTGKDRKSSFSRKAAAFTSPRRRANSNAGSHSSNTTASTPGSAAPNAVYRTDAAVPPALPDYALSAAAKVAPLRSPGSPESPNKMLNRTITSSSAQSGQAQMPPPPTPLGPPGGGGGGPAGGGGGSSSAFWQSNDANTVHSQITELATKRIGTLDYLRKAHSGRVYWFNSYLFEKSDLYRMPFFDQRRLARKATNCLLLGVSLPVLIDLYSSTPHEFLRSWGALLSEYDSFQQLRNDSSASLSRARLPNMFRRPGGKGRRSTSASDSMAEEAAAAAQNVATNGGMSGPGQTASTPSVMNFAASESELLPGEEYAYLLTPSLPFEPDYFETFATLCDALIDCYTRFLQLVPTSRECTASVAELFTKADARVRKTLIQGIVKDFEDHSRANVKSEVANVGKVVLGGLM